MENLKITVGGQTIDLATPAVMTILNVTPDSFYAGSRTFTETEITRRVEQAVTDGASVIDVGGYSSRSGADEVAPDEEFARIARGFSAVRRVCAQIPVSIDTFRSEVARRVLDEFGPCIVNDISGGELDPRMIRLAAEHDVPFIAMHMRGTPATMQQYTEYNDPIDYAVEDFFETKIMHLRMAGVGRIILDPGFGFAKTTAQNYELLAGMDRFRRFGLPVLAGVSRKSMIYRVLDSRPEDALAGTAALNWECLMRGASILRVHDTREAADVIRLFNFYKTC